jgi:hypothetical protein
MKDYFHFLSSAIAIIDIRHCQLSFIPSAGCRFSAIIA